jgi:uncharacterized protein with NAD-binding domain and iron-sulfur cluster
VSASVAVLGGGVAGLSTAHELAERGFSVAVYESRATFGGKSRSIPVPGSASDGRPSLPAEHGFRFFPGFYRHLPDTLSRIPGRGRERVSDDLIVAELTMIARAGEPNAIVAPAESPLDEFGAVTRFLAGRLADLGIDAGERAFFLRRLLALLTSCDERRFGQLEHETWWSFMAADRRSPAFRALLVDGLMRTLVAAPAREVSARTGGYLLLQRLFDLARADGRVDRLFDAPTNDVWIEPWLEHLGAAGVELHANVDVVGIDCRGGRIEGVTVERDGSRAAIAADHYVAALPVEQLVKLVSPDLAAAEPSLGRLWLLRTRWTSAIVFYLREDVPVVAGPTIYADSDWALTSVSQRQFWPRLDFPRLGHGNVGGILSVDICDWERPSRRTGKVASMCSAQEIKDEVWAQLDEHLNTDGEVVLDHTDLVGWYLDDHISFPNPTAAANAEPVVVNTPGSWANRPEAVTAVPNLFVAADFVRTHTDVATMEAANEAARRAVNGVLDAAGSTEPRCAVWPLPEPAVFVQARALDRLLHKLRLPPRPPLRASADGALESLGPAGRLFLPSRGATQPPRRPR